jgi:hypothetical protein
MCAWIVVVTRQATFSRAITFGAAVAHRACVGVVAVFFIGSEEAANDRIAAIVGAWITVLTGERSSACQAFTTAAAIAQCAGVCVIARSRVG